MSAIIIVAHLTNIIKSNPNKLFFPQLSYISSGKTYMYIMEKEKEQNEKKYRTVSILNWFSKVYEKFLHE